MDCGGKRKLIFGEKRLRPPDGNTRAHGPRTKHDNIIMLIFIIRFASAVHSRTYDYDYARFSAAT